MSWTALHSFKAFLMFWEPDLLKTSSRKSISILPPFKFVNTVFLHLLANESLHAAAEKGAVGPGVGHVDLEFRLDLADEIDVVNFAKVELLLIILIEGPHQDEVSLLKPLFDNGCSEEIVFEDSDSEYFLVDYLPLRGDPLSLFKEMDSSEFSKNVEDLLLLIKNLL